MLSIPIALAKGVEFRYGRTCVLDNLSFEIGPGVTALLGPNGAGKSTLLTLLGTRRPPSAGRLEVLGRDVGEVAGRDEIRRRVGYLPQRPMLVGSMRVRDTVAYAAWAAGISRAECDDAAGVALRRAEIHNLDRARVSSLSGGQRQRVALAAAIVAEPELLVLDEPTAGLDPGVRLDLRRTLTSLSPAISIVWSTHMLEDVTACDHVLLLHHGRLVYQGSAEAFDRRLDLAADLAADFPGSRAEQGYASLLDSREAR